MADPHTNFGYSTVATAPSPATSGLSLVVQAGDGAKFPSSGAFNATVWPASTQPTTANAEIVRCTVSGDTFTLTRAQESTSARTIVVGDQIAATITAKTLTDVELDVYVTTQDKTIPATTQVLFESYLELAASFFYELSTDAILTIGDFATPLALPDQNTNIFVSVADETIPRNSEIVFSDFYEVSAPFGTEIGPGGFMQLGTSPDIVGPFLPGYELNYTQITANVTVSSITEATPTIVISPPEIMFDGAPVICEVLAHALTSSGAASAMTLALYEGTTQITRLHFFNGNTTGGNNQEIIALTGSYRFAPTAGYHTYTLGAFTNSVTGGPLIAASSGGANYPPAFIRFVKV